MSDKPPRDALTIHVVNSQVTSVVEAGGEDWQGLQLPHWPLHPTNNCPLCAETALSQG